MLLANAITDLMIVFGLFEWIKYKHKKANCNVRKINVN